MPVAIAILPSASPLGDVNLAGETPARLLKQAAAGSALDGSGSTLVFGQITSLPDWSAMGVERIFFLREDYPLIAAGTIQNLAGEQFKSKSPLVVVRSTDGEIMAGCALASWFEEQSRSSSFNDLLNTLAARPDIPWIIPSGPSESLAVDSQASLAEAKRLLRQHINTQWMRAGVVIEDPAATYIDMAVNIGPNTYLLPNTYLWGKTTIGEDCRIGPNSIVRDSQIGSRCTITASVVEQAVMDDESDIGPFGHLRKGARLCRGAHMGNYGEMKNSTLGANSKMGHFSYLGDATVGEDVNIGAGTITCNYDGVHKHKTIIKDGAFIGSDAMLVAPLQIGAGARIGAGSVVTHDVPDGAVAYGVPARVKNRGQEKGEEGDRSGPSK